MAPRNDGEQHVEAPRGKGQRLWGVLAFLTTPVPIWHVFCCTVGVGLRFACCEGVEAACRRMVKAKAHMQPGTLQHCL